MNRLTLFLCCLAISLGVNCGGRGVGPTSSTPLTEIVFSDSFAGYPNGLITNEYASRNPGNPQAKHSPNWEMTSGSLFALNGEGWTGVPDNRNPGPLSLGGTNSAVFRLTTKQPFFGNVRVRLDLLNQNLSQTSTTPALPLDGVHIFLRYQTEENLYYASVNRRDNTVVIKKKVPGGNSNGGTYHDLSSYVPHPVPYGQWQQVTASVQTNGDGSVTITLTSGGQTLLNVTDRGEKGGPPITSPGKVGIRGDNADFKFKNFTVQTY